MDNLADAENSTAAEEEEQKKREAAKLSEEKKLNGEMKKGDESVTIFSSAHGKTNDLLFLLLLLRQNE